MKSRPVKKYDPNNDPQAELLDEVIDGKTVAEWLIIDWINMARQQEREVENERKHQQ